MSLSAFVTNIGQKAARHKKLIILSFIAKILITASVLGFAQEPKKGTEVIKIKTSAVCGMCKNRIEKGLIFEKGIKDVNLDLETKIATVKYKTKKTNPDKIRKMISKLGHDADEVPADQKAYDNLPPCCKKDAPPH